MKLTNRYFKVELKIFYENHNHIEKDFFRTIDEAENCFEIRENTTEYGFLQNRFNEYALTLSEHIISEQRTIVHKIRKVPM